MNKYLLVLSSVLLSVPVHAAQLYGWIGKPAEGQNYFILDSDKSVSGSLANILSLTLLMPNTGETTYTPSSVAMTLGPGFYWSTAEIESMSLSFTTPRAALGDGEYWCYMSLAEGKLNGDESVVSGGMIFSGPFVDDSTGHWLAFGSLADYQSALATLGSSPEPGTTALLLLGAFGLVVGRRVRGVGKKSS
jgi:hypothetical protein